MPRTWIKIKDQKPKEGQRVIYYFEITGVGRGYYTRHAFEDIEMDCFIGNGWLCDDVTHWMADDGGELPGAPKPNNQERGIQC